MAPAAPYELPSPLGKIACVICLYGMESKRKRMVRATEREKKITFETPSLACQVWTCRFGDGGGMMQSWRTAAREPAHPAGSESPAWRAVLASHSSGSILQCPFSPSSTSSRLPPLSSCRIPLSFSVRMLLPVLMLTIALPRAPPFPGWSGTGRGSAQVLAV